METLSPKIKIDIAALVKSSIAGNESGFRQLYELYNKAMYNICVRMLNDSEEAKDVLQESFIAAFQRIKTYKESASFGSWLKSIVINRCIDTLRKRKFDLLPLGENDLNDEPLTYSNDEDYDVNDIYNALKQLPDGYRLVLNLYLFEDYSHKMISEKLGISEGTSKSQYARARKKLAEQMNKNKSSHAG